MAASWQPHESSLTLFLLSSRLPCLQLRTAEREHAFEPCRGPVLPGSTSGRHCTVSQGCAGRCTKLSNCTRQRSREAERQSSCSSPSCSASPAGGSAAPVLGVWPRVDRSLASLVEASVVSLPWMMYCLCTGAPAGCMLKDAAAAAVAPSERPCHAAPQGGAAALLRTPAAEGRAKAGQCTLEEVASPALYHKCCDESTPHAPTNRGLSRPEHPWQGAHAPATAGRPWQGPPGTCLCLSSSARTSFSGLVTRSQMRHSWRVPPASSSDTLIIVNGSSGCHWKSTT